MSDEIAQGLSIFEVEDRKSGVYGTDAPRIMAGELHRLWLEKTGREEPQDLYDRFDPVKDWFLLKHLTREKLELARLMGHATEPLNRFWYKLQTGRTVINAGEEAVHTDIRWMRCHLDGRSTTSKGFSAAWDAKHWAKLDDAAIARATAQMTHNATVCGYEWWILSVFVGNSKWQLVEQEVDPFYAAELIEREQEFWLEYVVPDREPPREVAAIVAPAPRPVLRTVSLEERDSKNWPNWAADCIREINSFASTEAAHKVHMIARKAIGELVPEDVGTLSRGLFRYKRDGRGVTMKMEDKDGQRKSRDG